MLRDKRGVSDLRRLPDCPFNIIVQSACKRLPDEGSYRLISVEEGENGMVTMVLELIGEEDV